jgi:hypothetical protein
MVDIDTRMALVEQKYQQLDLRLEKVENKLDDLSEEIKNGQTALIKVIVGTTGTILVALITTIGVIIAHA